MLVARSWTFWNTIGSLPEMNQGRIARSHKFIHGLKREPDLTGPIARDEKNPAEAGF